jgi:alcohol dehydrogenase class IV
VPWDSVHPFECPTRVLYGRGAAGQAGERLRELGVTKALIVTDPGVRDAGVAARVEEAVRGAGLGAAVYAGTQPNPTTTNVHEAAELYAAEGCDGVVGVGGGSAMDCAKAAGIVITSGGHVAQYGGLDKVPEPIPPTICVPTTCGTGAEVTFNAVITDEESHFKIVLVSRRLAPHVALVDPDLVAAAPPHVIAATGADALCHAVESYVNTGSDPLLDALDIGAIRMIGRYLRAGVNEHDPEAIAQLTLASTMAGVAFNMNGNAIVHAASTPVTAHHGVPHGVANGIFMPAGLDFLKPACRPQLSEIAEALGEDVAGLSLDEAADRGVVAIRELMRDVGIPSSLVEWGVDPATVDIPRLVEDAMKSRNVGRNPRPVGPEELAELYRAVLWGDAGHEGAEGDQ